MIVKRINEWARSQPSNIAIISNGRVLTYAAFARSIERARIFFERATLPQGWTAIILETPGAQIWPCVMALRALGLNTLCIDSPEQIKTVIQKDVACVVVPEVDTAILRSNAFQGLQVLILPETTFSTVSLDDPLPESNYTPSFGGHILLTSGTTGTYKKVFLKGTDEDRRNAARARAYPLTKNVIYHAVNLGLWTTIGFRLPSAVWHVGGCVITDHRSSLFQSFFHHDVNFSILTPGMLKKLVESKAVCPNPENCELQITAGFLPMNLAKTVLGCLAKNISISYGSTELSTPALLSRSTVASEELYWLTPADRKIRIVDESGNDCSPGQEGELRIQLWEIDCSSYFDDEETSARIFRDRFFCPGDMAVNRADGRVRVLGRTTDVLKLRGNKVATAPIELEIQRALNVSEVCLFSGVNHVGEEELVVVIESEQMLSFAAIDRITAAFPSFERVRFAFFKEFPRVQTGTEKVARIVLRKWVFDEEAGQNNK